MSTVYTLSIASLYTAAHVLWAVTQDLILFPLTWGKVVLKAPASQFTDYLAQPAPRLSLSSNTEQLTNAANDTTTHRYFAFTTLAIVLLSPFIASFLTLQYLWKEKDNIPFLFQQGLVWFQAPPPPLNKPQKDKSENDISSGTSKQNSRPSTPDEHHSSSSGESDEEESKFFAARMALTAALNYRPPGPTTKASPPQSHVKKRRQLATASTLKQTKSIRIDINDDPKQRAPKSPLQTPARATSPAQENQPNSPLATSTPTPRARDFTTAQKTPEDLPLSPETSCPVQPSLAPGSSVEAPSDTQPQTTPASPPASPNLFTKQDATSSNSEATP